VIPAPSTRGARKRRTGRERTDLWKRVGAFVRARREELGLSQGDIIGVLGCIDADADPDNEATTLVEFLLEAVAEGTQLTIVESGFDRVPAHRRERAFRMNEGGWATQAENLKKYVEGA